MLSGSLTSHSPRSTAILWCVRTTCPDIFCREDWTRTQSGLKACVLAMDSKKLSSISDCFGDQKAIKTPKLNTIWLKLIARVLNMLIGLKCDNYYSKVFKRVNHKLSNSTFWVVITYIYNLSSHKISNFVLLKLFSTCIIWKQLFCLLVKFLHSIFFF